MQELDQVKSMAEDEQLHELQFDFAGEWMPNLHPLKIANGNYSDVANIRYVKTGIISVNGYTKINSTPLTNLKGRSGFQLRSPYTLKSQIFTHQFDTNLANGKLYRNLAIPPATGDFEGSLFHTDLSGAKAGRFTEVPNNNMIYCNEVESLVYGGDESQIAAFIKAVSPATDVRPSSPIVYTNELRNTLQDSLNTVIINTTTNLYFIGSTRPLSGMKVYILSPNSGGGQILNGFVWTGSWTALTNLVDNTYGSSGSHQQTGTVTWDDTVSTAKPALINEDLFYWYYFKFTNDLSPGNCTIYHVTIKSELQPLVDLWDGINRTCIQFQVSKSDVYCDYTAEVADISSSQYPIAAKLSGLLATDHIIFMFSERTTAILLSFIAGLSNKATVTIDNLYYWNGIAWVSVGVPTIYDTTLTSTNISFSKNGAIFWDSPAETSEHPVWLFNTFGYAYKIVFNGTLTTDVGSPLTSGVYLDTFYGVPAVKKMPVYKFAFNYKNRIFLAGKVAGKEGNVIDYGVKDTVDCYNGLDSSSRGKQLTVGKNNTELVATANVFNRFGASLYNSEIILKASETFLLDGTGPDDFTISQISENIGCVAPKTLVTAEISFEATKDAVRNIAIWVSQYGPMIFDAAVIVPLRGIELVYFKPDNPLCVNFNALNVAHAWFNPRYYEYNVCLPSGIGQTTCNVWLTYNLIEKKWSKIATGTKHVPQATIKVIDDYSTVYFYGLIDSGHMVNLENGILWDGTEQIESFVVSNYILPAADIFKTTIIRNVKLISECGVNYDLSYTRFDFEIVGAGFVNGDLRIFGNLIEDPACTVSYWSGDDFVCKQLIENATIPNPPYWQEVAGVVSIAGVLIENCGTKITTVAGNFLTAGFIPGLLVKTSDPNNYGPYLCTTVVAQTMTFNTAKGIAFGPGLTLTLSVMFAKIEYYKNGAYTLVPLEKFESFIDYARFISSCNYTGIGHKFKFSFYSLSLQSNVKPLLWGIRFIVERVDV